MKHCDDGNLIGIIVYFGDDNVRQADADAFISSLSPTRVPEVRPNARAIGRPTDASNNFGCRPWISV